MSKDILTTRLCDDLGLEYPIVGFTHCKDVVVELANAGGLGVFGAGATRPEHLKDEIKWIRERVGSRPFGVDVLLPASAPESTRRRDLETQIPQEHRDFINKLTADLGIPAPKPRIPGQARTSRWQMTIRKEDARNQLDTALEERVPVFASGLGSPAFMVEAAHSRGIKVMGLVGTVRQAVREAEAGVDYIVAQGYEAGGHTGDVGTFALVPQVVDAVSPTPVVAAGGVGSGRQLVASLALGAVGVWTGTLWLTARESDTDIIVKQKLLDATERDTVRSRCLTGKHLRQLRTKWTDAWDSPDAPNTLPLPLQGLLMAPVLNAIDDYRLTEFMGSPAGQGVGLMRQLRPVRQIILDLMNEARDILDSWAIVPA